MTVVINMHKTSCHDYEGVMSVSCTPLSSNRVISIVSNVTLSSFASE